MAVRVTMKNLRERVVGRWVVVRWTGEDDIRERRVLVRTIHIKRTSESHKPLVINYGLDSEIELSRYELSRACENGGYTRLWGNFNRYTYTLRIE